MCSFCKREKELNYKVPLMNIKGIIFDLDGVIVDTAKYHYIAWKELSEKLNLDRKSVV